MLISGTNGGGVDWLAGANYGKIYNCIFNNTRAARSAGAIYYDGWYGELINITIIGTVSNGGTLKTSKDGRVKYAGWDSSHWDTNTTGGDAGAIMFTGNHEYVYNVTFTDCFSIGRGGAIFLQDNENVTIESCYFINNHANGTATNTWKNYTQERDDSNNDTKLDYKLTGHGGAVAFDVNAKNCKILYSKFYENSARRNGGAINFDEGSVNNTIRSCDFENNTVYDDGGAINFDHGSDYCSIYNSTFYNNTGLGRLGSTTKGGTICLTGSHITIADSQFILGVAYANTTEGAKLNETDGGALFITGNDVIITNATFINCSTPNYAGAIKIIGNNTYLDECIFENCTAPKLAGAIYVLGNSVTINESSFHLCYSDIAGAIYIQGENANVIDSQITNCSSITSAGAIHIYGNHTDINGTSFVNCTTAGTHGGAICISGEYTIISNSTFEYCQAQFIDLVADQGAIGGAIHISGNNATIIQSLFNNNFATDDGGAIYVSGIDCELYNSTFRFNSAGDDGGAILWEGRNGLVYNSTFKNNRALGLNGENAKGGAINIIGHNSVVTKSHFEMNEAKLDGGAIYATGNYINITDSTFDKSNVTVTTQEYYGHGGGSIFIEGNYTFISNSNFTRSHGGEGGVIYVQGHHATIDGIATDYTYASNGGAVYVKGTDAVISNSNFTRGNATLANGGSIFVEGRNANITGCILQMGQAAHGGGSIFVDGVNTNIEKSSFANNGADVHGGSIYIEGANAKITDCNLTQSHANQLGGIIYIANGQNAVINGSSLSISYAQKGGAVYIDGKSASIINSNITDTYARNSVSSYTESNLGGAVYIKGNNANISGSVFNSAHAYRGGIIYLEGSYCTVTDSVLNNSYTVEDGGGIYSTGSYSHVYNSNITNNYAGGNGGGIYWYGGTDSKHNHVVGCTFINNSAHSPGTSLTYGGGGIYWSSKGSYGLVKDCVFIRNYADGDYKADGGAILWDQSSHGVIDHCVFDGNYVTSRQSTTTTDDKVWVQGGALFLRVLSNYTITNCVFKNSWSSKEAGAVYLSSRSSVQKGPVDIYVANITFINNTAYGVGGLNNYGGGALMVKEVKYVILDNITFINNTANQGGALSLYLATDKIIFNNCNFTGNEAVTDGGSIWTDKCGVFNNITISDSIAGGLGGGMYATKITSYNNLTFINNRAENGGGLYWYLSTADIQKINFINNTANKYGGAVYIDVSGSSTTSPVKVIKNNFTGNHAAISGGAVYVSANFVNIKNNNFTKNTAQYGGAIYDISTKGSSISDSYFAENNADYGGAIYSEYKGTEDHITNCYFIRNTATDGGAIYLSNTNQKIGNCIFEGNNASRNGGCIFVSKDLSVTIHDSIFKHSHANNGGGIYYENSTSTRLSIDNNTFIKNVAFYNGGAVLYITNKHAYRDYNNFDNIPQAQIDPITHRTDVYATDTSHNHFIITSLFEDNEDYILQIETISDIETPTITVYLTSPRDGSKRFIRYIVNLTDLSTGNVTQFIVNETNYQNGHYDYIQNLFYTTFNNLKINQTYNITVGFYDENYMYKEIAGNATAQGRKIGPFTLLQEQIERNITMQKKIEGITHYTIILSRDYTFTPYYLDDVSEPLDKRCINLTNIDKPIVFIGNSHVVDAAGYARIFNITATNVTFIDVQFINGNSSGKFGDKIDIGGAIFWSGANGTVIGSIFDNNYAGRGGAIYFNVTAENAEIINSNFINNVAETFGGAIDCNASNMGIFNNTFESNRADTGAALCREINSTLGHGYNNTFRSNYALTNGSALAWIDAKSMHVDSYYFYNNKAGNSGGAIYVGQGSLDCQILNSIFENNYVTNTTGGHGGAIEWYAGEGIVFNSNFTNNYAYYGGAIYVGKDTGEINITKSNFYENHAIKNGGAFSIEASNVTVTQSNFYDNYAVNGGALYVGGNGTTNHVSNSTFKRNKAYNGIGGAVYWVASAGNVTHSEFTGNCADYGGGIYFGGSADESSIIYCRFTDNHAKYTGGAIDCNSSSMTLKHTVFDANWAQFGAALCRGPNAQGGQGENNTFINNHAYVSGGALAWMGSSNIVIRNYTFINNVADISGGAIYASPDSDNCSIIDSVFENNRVTNVTSFWDESYSWTAWNGDRVTYYIDISSNASQINRTFIYANSTVYYYKHTDNPYDVLGVGGAVNVLATNATIIKSNFTGNYAKFGGALNMGANGGNTIINGSRFITNVAYQRGGAVNMYASAVDIDNSDFINNFAANGGAVYVGGVGTNNKIHKSIFTGNNATDHGAGVYWRASAGEIKDSEFTSNSACYGGGIYLNGVSANTNITNVVFKSNRAVKNGGAIECNASNIGIYNILFDSNYAGGYGAGLCRETGATNGHGTNNTFISNHAEISGGALAWIDVAAIKIYDYNFTDNTAGRNGGAIYISQNSPNCLIQDSVFTGNHLTILATDHNGGAIDCAGNNLTINMSSFDDNGAYTGGAVYVGSKSNDIQILYSNFTNNYAKGGNTSNGGAIGLKANNLKVEESLFLFNTAEGSGGAIYAGGNGSDNKITRSVFDHNTAGRYGGAIDWLAKASEISYSNFTNNNAIYGGAIYLNGVSGNSLINYVIFENNHATKNGGAIDCNARMISLNNTIFRYNIANEYGAGLCREANATGGFGGNNTFIGNHADIAGAALAWLGVDDIRITNYRFINNTADLNGGAIFVRQDSSNCSVINSYFDNNYITDKNNGRGGSIDWLGRDGRVLNTTFISSYAAEGGTIFVGNDNINISKSQFLFSVALQRGGAIAGFNASNATIDNCLFNYTVSAGFVDASLAVHGEGGSIYWNTANGLSISNSRFLDIEARANGGAISLKNCNNSELYNLTFAGELANRYGGSISWINSTNITVDSSSFKDTAASFGGGSLYLVNVDNATVKNSTFNNTSTPWGEGGAIYVSGNSTIDNCTFFDFDSKDDRGDAIFVKSGTSTISNSTFNGVDAIWIYTNATAYVTLNFITGKNPNRNMTYLDQDYDSKYYPVDYSVWNDGVLYLKGNNFDYVIFNNGTIKTPTTMYVLDNETWEAEWNTTFVFWANIIDDNNNTIISVDSLDTYNDIPQYENYTYKMPYNRKALTVFLQGKFLLSGTDSGLEICDMHPGTLKVKMPTTLVITHSDVEKEDIYFYATITTPVLSNFTVNGQRVQFKIGDKIINGTINEGGYFQWKVARSEIVENHMHFGTYTVTATYDGDDYHFGVMNTTLLVLESHQIWIAIHIDDIFYGQTIVCNVSSNATNTENGFIIIRINGKEVATKVKLEKDGSQIVNITYDMYKDIVTRSGAYTASVMFNNGTYYNYQLNFTAFNVEKINTTVTANLTTPITHGEPLIINVTVNENATGFVKLVIGDEEYIEEVNNGTVQFVINGLAVGEYVNKTLTYSGDVLFSGNSTNISFTINKQEKYIFDVIVVDIIYGDNATMGVVLPTDATGNVTFYIDGNIVQTLNLTNGTARLYDIAGLEGGDHVVNVTYHGDSTYAPGDNNGTVFKVNPKTDWKFTITTDERPYGENTTIYLYATGLNLLKDNVTITIDDIPYTVKLVNGMGNLTLNNLSAGRHSTEVIYDGDANYANNSQNFYLQIEKATPTITLTEINGNVIATVSGNATGNVTFYINGEEYTVNLTGRNAVLINKLKIGNNGVLAIYNGDENYTNVKTFENYTVDKLQSLVNVTVNDTVYGDTVEIIVRVGENQTGFVKILVNGKSYIDEIDHNLAKFYIDGLNAKEYLVNVTYYGDDTYYSNVNSTKFNITKANMSSTVTGINVTVEQNIAFIISDITPGFKGRVNITVNGTSYIRDIKALIELGQLLAGNYSATVTFFGDENYSNKTYTVNFTVSRITPTVNVTINDVYYPNNATALITVSDNANGTVNIYLGETLIGTGTVINGQAIVNITRLAAGSKQLTVKFITSDTYNNNATASEKFNVLKGNSTVSIIRNGTDIIAIVTPELTGKVVFYINAERFENDTVNGNATIKGKLHIGNNTVTVIYEGNENYTGNETGATFEILKTTTGLTVEATPIEVVVGKNTTITVTMVNVTNGKVIIEVNGYNYTVDINSGGIATLNIALPVGSYTAHAYYIGDSEHEASDNISNIFNVTDKITPEINITAPDIAKVGETINITVESNGYNLTVWINGVKQTIVNGNISYTVPSVGIKTIYTQTTENDTMYAVNKTVVFEAIKNNATLIISDIPENIKVGDEITITVTNTTDGEVTIKVNGVSITDTKFAPDHEGNYTITVESKETDKYYAGFNLTNFTVKKRSSQLNVTAAASDVLNKVLINVTIPANATGYVIININGTNYTVNTTEGRGSVAIKNLASGDYWIHATYIGDDQYMPSTNNTETFTVSKLNLTEIQIDAEDIVYGNPMNITVTVPATVTGTITLKLNDTTGRNITLTITNGKVTWIVTGLAAGNYTVHAVYNGNDYYNINDTQSKTFEVEKANPGLYLVSFEGVVYENATIRAYINEETAGEFVNITVGTRKYSDVLINSDGRIELTTDVLDKIEPYEIIIEYGGNANFIASKLNGITGTPKKITNYGINVTGMNITVGDDEIITVEVPEHVDDVVIWVNGTSLRNSSVTGKKTTFNITYLNLTQGVYTVTATVNDTEFDHQNFTSLFTVRKTSTPMTITVINDTGIYAGDTVKIIVTVPDDVDGNVTIEINNIRKTNVTVNGNATFYIPSIAYGDKTVVASYMGDDKYLYNSTTANFTVSKHKSNVNITVNSSYEIESNFNITIGNNTTVNVTINGVKYDVDNGNLVIDTTKLTAGNYTVTATIYESDNYLGNITSKTFIIYKHNSVINEIVVPDVNTTAGQNVTVTVIMGNVTDGSIIIEIGKHNYTVEIVNGNATLVIALPVGNYTAHAYFLGNDKYNATDMVSPEFNVTGKLSPTIIINADKVVEIDNNLVFNITNSTPVVVTINGKVYNLLLGLMRVMSILQDLILLLSL